MSKRVIGLMTGTSVDGIDLAIAEFSEQGQLTQIFSQVYPLSSSIQQRLHALCQVSNNELERYHQLAIDYTRELTHAVHCGLNAANLTANDIDAIGNHGQTIRHCPERGFSIQLADNQRLAVTTGIPVIAEFRQKDLALGGQGAPLAPAFHRYYLNSCSENVAVVNLGGIANVSYLPHQDTAKIVGFDTGPANTLLDFWYRQHHQHGIYDTSGHWAASGQVIPSLLSEMLTDEYFARSWPKSTGREYFNGDWLASFNVAQYAAADVQATLVQLTVDSVYLAIEQLDSVARIIVCGGGAHNAHLMSRLQSRCLPLEICTSDKFGIPVDDVEALLFAWLAHCFLTGTPSNLPSVTGASASTVLGTLFNP